MVMRHYLFLALLLSVASLWLGIAGWFLVTSSALSAQSRFAVGAGAVIGFAVLTSLFASRAWRQAAVISGISAIFVLFLVEAYFVVRDGASVPYLSDVSDKLVAFERLRANGVDSLFHMPVGTAAKGGGPINLAGKSNTQTVICRESEGTLIIDTDRYGFNNPPSVWDENIATVVLGDSFAEGWCVPVANSLSRRIAHGVFRGTMLNIAYAGHGPLEALGALIEYGAQYRPRNVLWFLFEGNDIADLERAMDSELVRYLDEPGYRQDLIRRQTEIDQRLQAGFEAALKGYYLERDTSPPLAWGGGIISPAVASGLRLSKLRARLGLTNARSFGGDLSSESLQNLHRVARKINALVRGWGGELTVVYLPYLGSLQGQPDVTATQNRIFAAFDELGIPVLDATVELSKHEKSRLFGLGEFGGHYSSHGQAVIAEMVADYFRGQ